MISLLKLFRINNLTSRNKKPKNDYSSKGSTKSSSQTINPKKPPINIAIVDLGVGAEINLSKMCKSLNECQQRKKFKIFKRKKEEIVPLFKFHLLEGEDLGEYDYLHTYTDQRFYDTILQSINGSGLSYGIGITADAIQQSSFNRHDAPRRTGIITIDNAEKYNLVGKPIEKYVGYLVLCEAFCISVGKQLEHKERRGCLFDICDKKRFIRRCLKNPNIEKKCKTRLRKEGFKDGDIKQADMILSYIKKTDFLYGIYKGFQNPIAGFILGGMIFNIIFSFIENSIGITSFFNILLFTVLIVLLEIVVIWSGFHSNKTDK